MDFENLLQEMKTLVIFRVILDDEIIQRYIKVLESTSEDDFIINYPIFVSKLFNKDENFTEYVAKLILTEENLYVKRILKKMDVSFLQDQLNLELNTLTKFSQLSYNQLNNYDVNLIQYKVSLIDLKERYIDNLVNLNRLGYGIYKDYKFFKFSNKKLVGIKSYDNISFNEMIGYTLQKDKLVSNIEAFIKGNKANNTLLYGDAGCGKSSSCKALVNEYFDQGLRMIEVKRDQIFELEDIFESLIDNPLKFIVFIDDLSFDNHDLDYIYLKNVLEGSVIMNNNCLIFATSNRRHLIIESSKDRDEMFINDQIEETKSLASRFGLKLTYSKPDKDLYVDIVTGLAIDNGIETSAELVQEAERFALRNNGRSPRTAQQFIIYKLSK